MRRALLLLTAASISACTTTTHPAKTVSTVDTILPTSETIKSVGPNDTADKHSSKSFGPLKTALATYVDLDANGDNELLIVAQGNDTTSYICEKSKLLKLQRGDSIRIFWREGIYEPAGDPDYPITSTFAVDYELVKPGKLSVAIKNGMPKINYYYYDDHSSDYAKEMVHNAIKYYLVNTAQADIRAEMDYHKRNLLYTVERKMIKDKEAWIINICLDGVKPQPIHTVYYLFENPYVLFDSL